MKNAVYPLRLMKHEVMKLGVNFIQDYGIRCVFYNGNIYGKTTNNEWNCLTNSENFTDEISNHYNSELDYVLRNRAKYILRSEGLITNSFLDKLKENQMGNGLAVYLINEIGIVGYFFTINNRYKDALHLCINKLHLFEKIACLVDRQLIKIGYWHNVKILSHHKGLIAPNHKKLINYNLSSDAGQIKTVSYKGQQSVLTQREADILDKIKIYNSAKALAENFSISVKTAEWHIYNLKSKLNLHTKQELIGLSQNLNNTKSI
jgi:DNA-binding CsgD family transcriptional regulator